MSLNHLDDLLIANIFQQYTDTAAKLNAVNLAQGATEPIMSEQINQVLMQSLHKGWQYTDPRGLESLRTALASEYNNQYQLNEILVTSGCTESLYLGVFAAGKNYGSKIAFLEPFYPYYRSLTKLLNMEAIPISMIIKNGRMIPDLEKIESIIASGIRIFILNTPHNPSGWVINSDQALFLRKLADKYGVLLIVDEAYRYYTYDIQTNANDAVKILYENNKNIFILGSASKLLSVTGLRIGWMIGCKDILDTAYAAHLYTTYCHPAPLQQLVATILNNRSKDWFLTIRKHYIAKRDKLLTCIKNTGFQCESVEGGHFLLADYSKLQNQMNAHEFADYFAIKYGVMALPADIFYIKNCFPKKVRFSFSGPMNLIDMAIHRIANST